MPCNGRRLSPAWAALCFPASRCPGRSGKRSLYAAAFRINSDWHRPGDITKYMCVPWQADFYDCKDTWWPAARPDDVIPQNVFEEVDKAWRPGQPQVSEALEGRVKWDRGLGVSTLFRRPWQNPAEAIDDPRNSEWRGCDDMVRYWSELGFVVPRQTAWRGEDPEGPGDRSRRDGAPSICGNGRTRAFPLPIEFGRASRLPPESGGIRRERTGGWSANAAHCGRLCLDG